MSPSTFPEANIRFTPPDDLEESQCATIVGYHGQIQGGSCDGLPNLVVAWRPNEYEIRQIMKGMPIFLSFVTDALPPHFPSMDFHAATHPA